MEKHKSQSHGGVVGVFRDTDDANQAIDTLSQTGFSAIPLPSDQARIYRSNMKSDEILVCVECGSDCDRAKSILIDYGASDVGSSRAQAKQAVTLAETQARPILTSHDTERVIDIDGELEVKEGPYVEPDMTIIGGIAYP